MGRRWLGVLLALALPLAAACGEREEEEVDDLAARDKAPPAGTTYSVPKATGPGSPASQRVSVVNAIPREMTLSAEYDDRVERLGTIDGDVSAGFYIQADSGTRVTLVARDPSGTVRFEETFVLGDIQQVTITPEAE